MSDLNVVVLVGRLVRDPELRYTPHGAAVAEFTVAANRKFNRKDGEPAQDVVFLDVVAWNRMAEVAAEFLKKGRQVAVTGALVQDRWDDKDSGQKRSRIRLQAQSLQFLGGGSKDAETSDHETPSATDEALGVPEVPPPAPTKPALPGTARKSPLKKQA